MPVNVVLFFTREVSLQRWDEIGIFDREVALYRRLVDQGHTVTFLTYGNTGDLAYADRLGGISVRCNRWGLPLRVYALLMPLIHRVVLRQADVLKTNQTFGSTAALRAARLWKKPLIARSGYLWSSLVHRQHGPDSSITKRSQKIEDRVLRGGNLIIVTTSAIREDILTRLPELSGRVHVVPNYVDTAQFHPNPPERSSAQRLCVVGRLSEEKNLAELIRAMQDLPVALDLIGQGPIKEELEAIAEGNKRVRFCGPKPHGDLPKLMNEYAAFVLPSLYEGHPKALIEAMACGMPIICTDVPGIREVIRHDETGWLCGTDAASLREAIETVLADGDLRTRLGNNARAYALEHYALDQIVKQEVALYRKAMGRQGKD
jgi:glycosyltransferase involved in cell wall biosynthesis